MHRIGGFSPIFLLLYFTPYSFVSKSASICIKQRGMPFKALNYIESTKVELQLKNFQLLGSKVRT